jgi:serine/threonine protein kinase
MSDDEQPGAALIGVVLANSYEITRFIGRGGMGAVYEGRQLRLGQRVAIKIMSGDLASSREALVRFRREAEVTSRIGHPHIVHVFDFGSARTGEPFLVMEYLEGEDLERRLGRLGRIGIADTIHIVKQTAAALAVAHAKGVVHRDLKPANVFLLDLEDEADFVKVVDFGISKVKAATTKLTRSSVVMGTPDYMSPEQARGRIDEIDHRTDQWALAAMTYEMLSGRAPFAGEDVASVLYQVTREEPRPLSESVRGLPPEIGAAVHRGLSKRAVDRFPDITAFARALEEAGADLTFVDQPVPRQRRVSQHKETVAYGGIPSPPPASDPDTLPDPSSRIPAASAPETGGREKRTTFSQATGEAKIPFGWGQLRARPRSALAGAGLLAVIVAGWLAARSQPSSTTPSLVVPAVAPTAARTPTIQQLTEPPPSLVGPPLPSLEDLARYQAAAAARAAARLKATDAPDHLPNPFAEPGEPEWVSDFRPTQKIEAPLERAARPAPAAFRPVAPRPVTPPPRPRIEDPLSP